VANLTEAKSRVRMFVGGQKQRTMESDFCVNHKEVVN